MRLPTSSTGPALFLRNIYYVCSWYPFLLKLSKPQGLVRSEGLGKIQLFHWISNVRPPVCGIVPQWALLRSVQWPCHRSVNGCPFSTGALSVLSLVNLRGICGKPNGTGARFLLTVPFPVPIPFPSTRPYNFRDRIG
jgi:hypothetical protein